jgi:hypothetical protein
MQTDETVMTDECSLPVYIWTAQERRDAVSNLVRTAASQSTINHEWGG